MRSIHRSTHMVYRVEQKDHEREGQDDQTPFAASPLTKLCH